MHLFRSFKINLTILLITFFSLSVFSLPSNAGRGKKTESSSEEENNEKNSAISMQPRCKENCATCTDPQNTESSSPSATRAGMLSENEDLPDSFWADLETAEKVYFLQKVPPPFQHTKFESDIEPHQQSSRLFPRFIEQNSQKNFPHSLKRSFQASKEDKGRGKGENNLPHKKAKQLDPLLSNGLPAQKESHSLSFSPFSTINSRNHTAPFLLKTQKERENAPFSMISSREDHMRLLTETIRGSQKSLLITSYGILPQRTDDQGIYQLLREARQRGVRIYIYSHGCLDLDPGVLSFFDDHKIAYDDCATHAKILAADEEFVAIGSFSWLSQPRENDWSNVTFCLRDGEITGSLKEEIWKHLKYYRNLQYGNEKQIRRYEKNPYNAAIPVWELGDKTELEYLHSLEAHRDFIEDIFKDAKHRIILFSPFINVKSGYEEDFSYPLLAKALKRGVEIYFVCRETDRELNSLKAYLQKLFQTWPHSLHLIPLPNFHHKTIIVDDDMLTAGSFNWLSASRNEESEFSNHEATLLCNGEHAKPLIKSLLEEYPILKQEAKGPKIELKVPYNEKNKAKSLGACWDLTKKVWYIPPGMNKALFTRWI